MSGGFCIISDTLVTHMTVKCPLMTRHLPTSGRNVSMYCCYLKWWSVSTFIKKLNYNYFINYF